MITILMATYNGEKYLKEQIESLLSQSHSDFVLYVSDDCSTDSTWEILESFKQRFPDKIFTSKNKTNLGAKDNFLRMMASTENEYVMLSDQDDVWLPKKVEVTLAKMKEMESTFGKNMPLLVHTDLKVVDANLCEIHPSYRVFTSRSLGRKSFSMTLAMNGVSGCTVMYNKRLSELLSKPPDFCVMHDFWLQIVAASFGKIGYLDEPTILYRQHGANALGAKSVRSFKYKLGRLINHREVKNLIHQACRQAKSLADVFGDSLEPEKRENADLFASMPKLPKVQKWRAILRTGAYMDGAARNAAYFMFI